MRLGWYRPSQPVTIRADGFLPNIRPLGPRGWGNRQVRRDYALQPIPSPRREPRLSAVLPVVIWTEPPSGASDVDPGLRELRVAFSRPPVARAEWSWQPAGSPDQLPRSAGPVETLDGGRVLCIPIAPLRPNTVYAFWVNTPANAPLKDERGAPVVPYLWIFRTRPASTHSEKL
jgi:hypothetical protein